MKIKCMLKAFTDKTDEEVDEYGDVKIDANFKGTMDFKGVTSLEIKGIIINLLLYLCFVSVMALIFLCPRVSSNPDNLPGISVIIN